MTECEPTLGALEWLGRGVDMTSLTPFDMNSVQTWVKDPRIIALQNDTKTRKVTIDGVQYTVPSIVSASELSGVQRSDLTYSSGTEALQGFNNDPGASGHLAIVGNTASYPFDKSFPDRYQFAFFSLNADVYMAELREYLDFIDEKLLLENLKSLPQPFTADPEVVDAYKQFFRQFGSHVLVKATYGARCNLVVWASNKYPDVNANWKRDVTASVRGINNSGQYDETVFEEPQYQVFQDIAQTSLTILGGNQELASSLTQGQYDFQALLQWATSSRPLPAFASMVVTELWTILKGAISAKVRAYADSLKEAFSVIVEQQKQQQVSTLAILELDAGTATVGLLTPSAVVGVGGPLPLFDPTTQQLIGLSETKVRWGQAGAQPKNVIIPFYIVNDGSPIDLSIRRDSGVASVTINGIVYTNDDEGVSIKWFYKVPITAEKEQKVV